MKYNQKKPFQIRKPVFDFEMEETEDLLRLLNDCMSNDIDIHHKHIKNVCLENRTFSSIELIGIIFENCTITNSSFAKSSFDNVLFRNCNFSNSNFSDSWFNCCEFEFNKNIGADFGSCRLFNVKIENSSFKYTKFTLSKFDTCSILKSDMSETFFAECSLKTMQLDGSKFIRTDFFKTSLSKLDFSTCDLQAIVVSDDNRELKGAIVNTYQAVELSKFLGIIIKDE